MSFTLINSSVRVCLGSFEGNTLKKRSETDWTGKKTILRLFLCFVLLFIFWGTKITPRRPKIDSGWTQSNERAERNAVFSLSFRHCPWPDAHPRFPGSHAYGKSLKRRTCALAIHGRVKSRNTSGVPFCWMIYAETEYTAAHLLPALSGLIDENVTVNGKVRDCPRFSAWLTYKWSLN